jgi:hypothetical protein
MVEIGITSQVSQADPTRPKNPVLNDPSIRRIKRMRVERGPRHLRCQNPRGKARRPPPDQGIRKDASKANARSLKVPESSSRLFLGRAAFGLCLLATLTRFRSRLFPLLPDLGCLDGAAAVLYPRPVGTDMVRNRLASGPEFLLGDQVDSERYHRLRIRSPSPDRCSSCGASRGPPGRT